jgi:hypothetical protein
LYNKKPTVTEIKPEAGLVFGILEARDGSIGWALVYRYDGNTIQAVKGKEGRD